MLDYFEYVERSLTNKETAMAVETISLESRTVIETLQTAWAWAKNRGAGGSSAAITDKD